MLWGGADILRSKMDANEYKDYLLGIVFYKYLSDTFLIKVYDLIYDEKPQTLKDALEAYREALEEESAEELKEQIKAEFHYVIEPDLTYTCFADAARNNYFNREQLQKAFNNAEQIGSLSEALEEIEAELHQKCREIPYAENILEIRGIGENILAGILAEMGDITRFDDASEIQKLSGLGLVACSSGKHKGETKISHRGRKRLRYWLFQAAKSAVSHGEEYKELHAHYTTRKDNPLKKMQSLIVIACKLLRIIFTILRTGCRYDPMKMLRDIKRPERAAAQAA